jgi:hypothetical protein
MAFFQNVFDQEFQGYMVLGDRKLVPTFKVPPNRNTQYKQISWNSEPYNLSSGSELTFNFCWGPDFLNWASVAIDVAGADSSATAAREVADNLNSDPTFSSMFVASVSNMGLGESVVVSKAKEKKQAVRMYFGNGGAEVALGFNKRSGVADIPDYFGRHTIDNRSKFPDSLGILIRLDPSNPADLVVIEAAGLSSVPMEDWEALRGRSGIFEFRKMTVDGSDRVTEMIEYSAGAKEGDLARKTVYSYSGVNKNPDKVTEVPYILEESDLVSP